MFGSLSKTAWVVIGAVVAAIAATVVVVALAVGGDDDDGDVATGTGTGTSEPDQTTEATSATTGGGTASSGTAVAPSTACDPVAPGEVLGRRDLDGDGVDELFVAAGAGASTDIIAVFRVEGCEAVQVTAAGSPAEFPVGAAARHVDGLHGTEDGLMVYSGTSTDAQAFEVTWRTLRYDGGVLSETASESGTAQMGDELYIRASTFSP